MRRYKHSLSHYRLTSFDMGELIPVGNVEVLPGDTFRHATSVLLRLSPLVRPVMHPVQVRLHHFFVPMRLLNHDDFDWESFITGGEDGADAQSIPTVAVPNPATDGPLLDYLGVHPTVGQTAIALPVRAFNLIYNEYFRDQDLVTELDLDQLTIPSVAWERDYYTSARLTSQKGAAVSLPLGTTAPVVGDGTQPWMFEGSNTRGAVTDGTGTIFSFASGMTGAQVLKFGKNTDNTFTGLETDLTSATSATINDLREAMALQRYEEARSRFGARYSEYLRYLGVTPQDARLQRPEYLGGGKQTIAFSEVLQTAEGASTPVGDLLGHGIAAVRSRPYTRFFPEHGYVMTLLSVRPKSIYVSGIPRKFLRATKEDFYQKELELIGAQEVLNEEIYAADSGPTDVFGYQDRYREYKEEPSLVTGEFRSTLNDWHLGRVFSSDVALNETFITCTPATRIFASASSDTLYAMCAHSLRARRVVTPRVVGSVR